MTGFQFLNGLKPILIRRAIRTTLTFPKLISQLGDLLLVKWVIGVHMPLAFFLCLQVRLTGMLQRLSRDFMAAKVIFFAFVCSAGVMGMGIQAAFLGSDLL